jgi:asparagine synthase (glutamine-hydrolysing)
MLVVTREAERRIQYWQIEPQPVLRLRDDTSYAEAFRERFFSIIEEYSDQGAAGVTLSGGMDSTSVAAALRSVAPNALLTAFSWVSPELPEADESRAIEAVGRKLRCPVITIAADQLWPLRSDPGILPSPAGPFFNFYSDLWDVTFRRVRAHDLRVLFSGLGGDHLFGGNVFSYPDLLLTGRWGRLVSEIRTHLPHSELNLKQLVRRMVLGPIAEPFLRPFRPLAAPASTWIGNGLKDVLESQSETPHGLLPGRRERLRVLRDSLLPAVAEMMTAHAAQHGIELRHPLLDHRLVELAASLPTSQTFSAGVRKIIMRNAMRGLLPDEVVERSHKVYLNTVAERGLREREQAKVWALMTNMVAAEMGFVDEERLREEYRSYLEGKTRRARFWHTLTLEAWLRRYFT